MRWQHQSQKLWILPLGLLIFIDLSKELVPHLQETVYSPQGRRSADNLRIHDNYILPSKFCVETKYEISSKYLQ
jgi:hypothetical protein